MTNASRFVTWHITITCVTLLMQMHLLSCGRSRACLLRCSCGEPLTRVEADDRRNWVVRPLPVAAAPRAPAAAPAPAVLDRHRLDHRTWCARVFATAWVRCVMPSSWNSRREVSIRTGMCDKKKHSNWSEKYKYVCRKWPKYLIDNARKRENCKIHTDSHRQRE